MRKFFGLCSTLADSIVARPRYVADTRATLDEDMVLTRYMDHYKYVDMIGTQSLYFTRLLRLRESDPDEGKIATAHYLADLRSQESDGGTNSPQQREAYRTFLEQCVHQQAYISCWYIGGTESARMWSEYVSDGRGVAVQTTVKKILHQFSIGDDGIKEITMTPIKYIKLDQDEMDGIEERDDTLAALKYKGDSWTHENEMRAIMLYNMFTVWQGLPKYGERMTVPMDIFLNKIIIAPNASEQYEAEAREMVSNTSLGKLLIKSSLNLSV